jgi:hypothetical protein
MDGFKSLPKMQCFKVGGSVKKEAYCGGGKAMQKGGKVSDKEQDKALIKKAFKQHDKAEHDKEPTEIKLKNGGRSKKAVGTVRKFKVGGSVNNVYDSKKDAGEKADIKKVKNIKAGKANSPSGAKGGPNKYAEGGEVIDMRDNAKNDVGDDARARAMKFLETGKKDSDAAPKTMRKSAPKAKTKDTSDQNDRRTQQVGYESRQNLKRLKEYDKPLESSNPEDYILPGGVLKGLLRGVVRSSEKAAAKAAEKKAAERAEKQAAKEAKDSTRRDAEGYSPEEAVRKIDEPARAARTESSGAMKDTFKPDEIREGFKKGGKIKKMADGSLTGRLVDNVMGSQSQNEKAKQDNAKYLRAKKMQEAAGKKMGAGEKMAMGLAGLGQDAPAAAPSAPAQMPPMDQMGAPTGMPMQKRGGRAGKK